MEEIYGANGANDVDVSGNNPLAAMQPGEKVLCVIKRHPFGMISQYVMAGFIVVVLGAFAAYVPQLVSQASQTQAREYALLGWALISVCVALGLFISSSIYYKNRWIVTNDSITQISQVGLFDSQMSQLSMANLQDIGVVQDGVLCSMFNFGILRAETAGERSKFIFMYCPDPKRYAREILMARENFINTSPETAKRGNDDLAVPRPPSDGLSVT
jgi:hypothetical protein